MGVLWGHHTAHGLTESNCLACLEAGLSCNPLGFNQFRLAGGMLNAWLATRALLL